MLLLMLLLDGDLSYPAFVAAALVYRALILSTFLSHTDLPYKIDLDFHPSTVSDWLYGAIFYP
jgi:hypothetical protein